MITSAPENTVREHLGDRALSYLLNLEPEALAARFGAGEVVALSDRQEAVLTQLVELDAQMQPVEDHPEIVTMNWQLRLSLHQGVGHSSLGNTYRVLAGGELPAVPDGLTQLASLVARLVVEAFPALLLPEKGHFGLGPTVSLFKNPLNLEFQDAVRGDAKLCELFSEESDHSGPSGTTLRSTGSGGGLQLWTFAETLIKSGMRLARARVVEVRFQEVVEATLECFQTLRLALSGDDATVRAHVGLTGVLLPEGINELDLGWGTLRKSDVRDLQFSRGTSLAGQLTSIAEGTGPITISYSGDVVLEVEIPYLVRLTPALGISEWPADLMVGIERLRESVESVRLGLLLAFPGERRVVVSSWRAIQDPLAHGTNAGWADVTRTPNLVPIQLTTDEANSWCEWARRVSEHRTAGIGVAIRRMLAAASERNSPDDVLVEAVIVWENLFGAKSETTLRVTSSLAWLLGESGEDRMDRQARYKKIYEARSSVVHGGSVKPEQVQTFSHEAVQISIDALRAVFADNAPLLTVKTSEERSLRILNQVP